MCSSHRPTDGADSAPIEDDDLQRPWQTDSLLADEPVLSWEEQLDIERPHLQSWDMDR